jgi:hypothetical protein
MPLTIDILVLGPGLKLFVGRHDQWQLNEFQPCFQSALHGLQRLAQYLGYSLSQCLAMPLCQL